jgi:predicted dehydrogenase
MDLNPSHPHSVLVIGCGSIGERHLRCFLNTGRVQAAVCDTNASLVGEVAARYGVPGFESLEAAQAAFKADAWVICTPAQTHLAITRLAMEKGLHVLIEKPLSISLNGVTEIQERLKSYPQHVAVAYVYHVMPWIHEPREALKAGAIGTPMHATVAAGQHFPTFRPAYRDIYYNRHETGGGAIQDGLTHQANFMEWLLGPTTFLFCDAAHQVLEGVEVEDTVNISARQGNVMTSYAVTQFQAPNETEIRIHGTDGSIAIQAHLQRWGVMKLGETEWAWHQAAPLQRDEIFTLEAHDFLNGIEGKATRLCTFDEAVQTLKFNLAALESARTRQPITIV